MVDDEPVGQNSRLRPKTESQLQPIEIDDNGDDASDFAPDDQSDHSATEFESDEEPQAKRGKGKGKAVPKGKAPAKSRVLEALRELDGESNPRVMLISLKGRPLYRRRPSHSHDGFVAGSLGLNLTVANNVFLWVIPSFTSCMAR